MQDGYTIPGKTYSVHSTAGCTVSDDTGWSKTLEAPEDYFTAHRSKVYIDDDAATVRELFKLAPQQRLALLGVLGGDKLPYGYTRIAYLMPMTNTARLDSGLGGWSDLGCRVRGFFDSSRTDSFSSKWFVLTADFDRWGALVYYFPRTALGFRMAGGPVYPQQDGLPDVSSGGAVSKGYPIVGDFLVNYNWLGDMQWKYNDADKSLTRNLSEVGKPMNAATVAVFGRGDWDVENWSGGIREVSFSRGEKIVGHVVPVLNELGQPTMWDLIRKTPLKKYSDGDFIAGIDTQAQFNNMLRKLPDRSGQEVGTLQVRLAEALQTEANLAALDAMVAKNWEISQAA